MDWSSKLRDELRACAETWAQVANAPHYKSLGKSPTILFETTAHNAANGNFHTEAWRAINKNIEWRKRLDKRHSQAKALPLEKRASARELDSSNSSDALLMNCFCFPRAWKTVLLGLGLPIEAEGPSFGFNPRLALKNGTGDETEVDMKVGNVIFEAKLTEKDFTSRPKAHVQRYKNFREVFVLTRLPSDEDSYLGYQLIRNVLAAAQLDAQLIVLLDGRRPDLLQEWWEVHSAIADPDLRAKCGYRTWQEVAAVAPSPLKQFLSLKYGL